MNQSTGMARTITGIIVGALAVVVLAAVGGVAAVYSGAYNVAATEEHVSFVRWALDTTMQNSVERQARTVTQPPNFTPEMVASGAGAYKVTCQHCHAGVGVERSSWANGMRPRPPHLSEAAAHWEPSEVFWLVKHGVRMTGMPAFGPTHDDQTIWSIVAFVKALPAMTPERYASLGSAAHGSGSQDHGHSR